jgi:hypothetical protein
MAIADSALRAAREVNADAIEGTNVPEIYRAAADNLFKAKREYRLKNFDRAKKYAMKATMLAEKAEFEAVKAGGATPEAAAARENLGLEGASNDTDLGYDQSINTGKDPALPEKLQDSPKPAQPPSAKNEDDDQARLAENDDPKTPAPAEDKSGAAKPAPATPPPTAP